MRSSRGEKRALSAELLVLRRGTLATRVITVEQAERLLQLAVGLAAVICPSLQSAGPRCKTRLQDVDTSGSK